MEISDLYKFLGRRRVAFKLFLLGVLGFLSLLGFCVAFPDLYKALKPYLFNIALPFWCLAFFSGSYLHMFKCPNCRERFAIHGSGDEYNTFTTRCVNCGLRSDGSNIDKL